MSPDDPARPAEADRPSRRGFWIRVALVGLVVVMLLAIAVPQIVAQNDDEAAAEPNLAAATLPTDAPTTTSTSTSSTTTTTTIPPTTTTTIPPFVQPAAGALPPVPNGSIRQGSQSLQLLTYEQRLLDLHFDPGPVDGKFDEKTRFAVETVDKLFGWPRDGVIDQVWVDALNVFQFPFPLVQDAPEADRVEIDLDKQVITVYKGYQVALITTTSTGNGKRFCGGTDGCQYAVTPAGKYKFQWHVNGWRDGDLGQLYNPWYFNGGIAVHGYTSVPTKPASHGCARVPMHVSEVFNTLVYKDMTVYVLGIQAPEGGYPADSPNGGRASSNGPSDPSPTPPPATAPPETAPPETAPPETAPPVPPPPDTAPPPATVAPVTAVPAPPPPAP
ncbi:MAG: L,D-transpeptidase family protein [Acidimicrobiia bacterium]